MSAVGDCFGCGRCPDCQEDARMFTRDRVVSAMRAVARIKRLSDAAGAQVLLRYGDNRVRACGHADDCPTNFCEKCAKKKNGSKTVRVHQHSVGLHGHKLKRGKCAPHCGKFGVRP